MRSVRRRAVLAFVFALGILLFFWPARTLRSDNFVFYLPNAHKVVPVQSIGHTSYLPLLEVLNAVGRVDGLQEKRDTLKVWFGNVEMELRAGQKKVRVLKTSLELGDPVRLQGGEWMVPLDFLTTMLPRIVHLNVAYRAGTQRIFIGDVKPTLFTVHLGPVANGARLSVQFSENVAVQTVSSNGKWIVYLQGAPVDPAASRFRFQNAYVTDVEFDDHDGVAKLIVSPAMDGLNFYPAVGAGGKVFEADLVKPPPAVAQQTNPPPAPAPAPSAAPAETEQKPALPAPPAAPAIVLDAGHGGSDPGAHSRNGVLEKDLTAQLVMRVRAALLAARMSRVVLTRVGDVDLSFDQRDIAANTARPEVFLSFHAGDLGNRQPCVLVYIDQPSASGAALPGDAPPLLLPWVLVQQLHRARSRQLGEALQKQFQHLPGVLAGKLEAAPVRVLRSVNAPAAAIEIGSLMPDLDSGMLTNPAFQEQIAAAITKALEDFQGGAPQP